MTEQDKDLLGFILVGLGAGLVIMCMLILWYK